MRNLIIICCLIFSTWGIAQNEYKRVIEYPVVGSSNTNVAVISKIELTDTATILHFNVMFRPKYWINIGADSRMQIGTDRYLVTKSEGIELDKKFWMPESGKSSYTLFFPPIPKDSQSFDYIGGDCTRCWKIYDIDLTGKSEYPLYPEKLPLEYRKAPKDGPLPNFQYKVGKTKLKVHILGYRKEMELKLSYYQSSFLTQNDEMETAIQEDGTASIEFDQFGTSKLGFFIDRTFCGNLWTAPGEQLDVYISMQSLARRNSSVYLPKQENRPAIFSNGHYENLNRFISGGNSNKHYGLNLHSGKFADYRMTAEQYIDQTIVQYDSVLNRINSDNDLPKMLKDYNKSSIRQDLFFAIANAPYFLQHNYKAVFNKWAPSDTIDYTFSTFESKHFDRIRKQVEFNTPSLPMGDHIGNIKYNFECPAEWITNTKKGLLFEINPTKELLREVENRDLTNDEVKQLKSYSTPFYDQIAETMMKSNRKVLSELSNPTQPIDVSNVKEKELLDFITSRHKGKVILIDIWNTWCAPCRHAIKQTEPLKKSELKSEDLVWVYLADETSPKVTYQALIPTIEGEHYRLSKKQSDYICNKFGIKTIPSYILVTKDGEMKCRTDFDNHGVMVNTLKTMIQ